MTDQPYTPPECDHHWISYMQPSAGLSWIRQCSQCRDFDADDLQEQIAAAEQRGAEQGWDEAMTSQIQRLISGDPDVERFQMPANPYRADQEGDE